MPAATIAARSTARMIAWRNRGLANVGLVRFMPKNTSAPSGDVCNEKTPDATPGNGLACTSGCSAGGTDAQSACPASTAFSAAAESGNRAASTWSSCAVEPGERGMAMVGSLPELIMKGPDPATSGGAAAASATVDVVSPDPSDPSDPSDDPAEEILTTPYSGEPSSSGSSTSGAAVVMARVWSSVAEIPEMCGDRAATKSA